LHVSHTEAPWLLILPASHERQSGDADVLEKPAGQFRHTMNSLEN
jgi:hypothetical protein